MVKSEPKSFYNPSEGTPKEKKIKKSKPKKTVDNDYFEIDRIKLMSNSFRE